MSDVPISPTFSTPIMSRHWTMIAYGMENYPNLEFQAATPREDKVIIKRARFEAAWQNRPLVKVRNSAGVVLYDGPAPYSAEEQAERSAKIVAEMNALYPKRSK